MPLIETRLLAATYLGRARGFRWLVRVPTFATNHDLRERLWKEHVLSMALSDNAETLAEGDYLAPEVRDARIANYYCAEHYLGNLPPDAPLAAPAEA